MYYKFDEYHEHYGTLFIRPNPDNPNIYNLLIDNKIIGKYLSPNEAAIAVAERKTGEPTWDNSTTPNNPSDLNEWTHVK